MSITRGISELQVVPGFRHNAQFQNCDAGVVAGSCACSGGLAAAGSTYWPGFTVDRLGLTQQFDSVAVVPLAWVDLRVSDENARVQHYAFSAGLQHTSASGGTFKDYSTGQWIENQGLWRQTTATATACAMYTAVQRDTADTLGGVMASATSTSAGVSASVASTSTGYAYYTGKVPVFDLRGAQRFIRAVVKPIINSTACGSGFMDLSATLLFSQPAADPQQFTAPVKRVLVTTGCAT